MLVSVSSRICRKISIFTARLGGEWLCTILHPPAGNPMSERALCTGRHRLLGTGGAPDSFSPWSPVTFQGWLELSPSRPGLRGHKKLGMRAAWGSTSLSPLAQSGLTPLLLLCCSVTVRSWIAQPHKVAASIMPSILPGAHLTCFSQPILLHPPPLPRHQKGLEQPVTRSTASSTQVPPSAARCSSVAQLGTSTQPLFACGCLAPYISSPYRL